MSLPYALTVFPSIRDLAVMGLSLFLREFYGLVLPYPISSLHAWVLSASRVLDSFWKIHLMRVLHTVSPIFPVIGLIGFVYSTCLHD